MEVKIVWGFKGDVILKLLDLLLMLTGELLNVSRVLFCELRLDTIYHVIPVLLLSPFIPKNT